MKSTPGAMQHPRNSISQSWRTSSPFLPSPTPPCSRSHPRMSTPSAILSCPELCRSHPPLHFFNSSLVSPLSPPQAILNSPTPSPFPLPHISDIHRFPSNLIIHLRSSIELAFAQHWITLPLGPPWGSWSFGRKGRRVRGARGLRWG